MSKLEEGWSMPVQARRFHYFRAGRSLCRSYGFVEGLQSPLEADTGPGPDDCTACRRKLGGVPHG